MGCGCGKRRASGGAKSGSTAPQQQTLGYEVTYPDGSVGELLFLSLPEAKAEVRAWGGGTIKRIVRTAAP